MREKDDIDAKDYDAVVLRFFERKTFKEIGETLGTTETAAKERVNGAVQKLRRVLLKNHVTISPSPVVTI